MTIVPRGNRFGVKVWAKGAKAYVWLGTFDTREQAEQAARDAGTRYDPASPLVSDWGRVWLSDYARRAAATRMVYRQAVNRITKDLGALRLDEVTRRMAREKALAWPRNTSAVARTMWADAKRDEVCSENPWTNMRLQQSRGRKDIRALTEPELRELADTAERVHRDYGREVAAIILTLGYTGIRPGELCGLRHEDVDLAGMEMHVRRSVDATGAEKLPKNGKQRLVTIPPAAAQALRAFAPFGDGYVFHSQRGRRLNKPSLSYLWRPVKVAWMEQGHEALDLYSLRHCAATFLRERGVDAATVAVQLGHTDGGALVLERYGHPSEDRARERLKMAYAETPNDASMRRTG